MADTQQSDQALYNKRHCAGVAKRLDQVVTTQELIVAGLRDLQAEVRAIIAERQKESPQ